MLFMLLQKPLNLVRPHVISFITQMHAVIEQIFTPWISLWINKKTVHVEILCGEFPGDLLQMAVLFFYVLMAHPFHADGQGTLYADDSVFNPGRQFAHRLLVVPEDVVL